MAVKKEILAVILAAIIVLSVGTWAELASTKTAAQALGVNCDSGVFYHGATAGLEYSF